MPVWGGRGTWLLGAVLTRVSGLSQAKKAQQRFCHNCLQLRGLGIMEKKMETTIMGHIETMEKDMETTRMGLYILRSPVSGP